MGEVSQFLWGALSDRKGCCVATLTVLDVDPAAAVERVVSALSDLRNQRLITIQDAAIPGPTSENDEPQFHPSPQLFRRDVIGPSFVGPQIGTAVGAG